MIQITVNPPEDNFIAKCKIAGNITVITADTITAAQTVYEALANAGASEKALAYFRENVSKAIMLPAFLNDMEHEEDKETGA